MANWGIIGCTSDAQLMAQARYDAHHTRTFSMKLNLRTDYDVICWLKSRKSKQGELKRLIRDEIERTGYVVPSK